MVACAASYAQIVNPPDAAEAFTPYAHARFGGSGQDSAQAIGSDPSGNLYVAGTTYSYDLPTRNAAQPESVEGAGMRSPDGGGSWRKISPPPTSRDVAFLAAHPSVPGLLFAGAADTVYRSTDGGGSWIVVFTAPVGAQSTAGMVVTVGFDATSAGRVYLYSSAGFSASNDLGSTWQTTSVPWYFFGSPSPGPFPAGIASDPHGSGALLLMPGLQNPWLSRDRGQTWTSLRGPVPSTSAVASFDPHHVGRIYLGVGAGAGGGLYVSDTWGQDWMPTASQPGSAVTQIVIDPETPDVLYVMTLVRLMTSENGGVTWKPQPALTTSLNYRLERIAGPACGIGPRLVATGGWQELLYSADRGSTWNPTGLRDVTVFAGGSGCTLYALKKPSGDAFVTKWNRTGQVEWATYLGGLGQDGATALVVDAQRNVVVAGFSSGQQSTDLLVAKYSGDGALLWNKSLGGEYAESAADLVVGSDGSIVVVGGTGSGKFPVTAGAARTEAGSGFALKLNPDGEVVWATYLADAARSAALEVDGSVLITAAGQPHLSRLSASGSVIEGLTTVVKQPLLVRTDNDGSIYLAGGVDPEERPVTPGAYSSPRRASECGPVAWPPVYSRGGDIQITKLRPRSLEVEFSALLGGECGTAVRSLDISLDQRITVGFSTQSQAFDTVGAIASAGFCRSYDLATGVAQLSADGSRLLRSTLLDGCDTIQVTAFDSDVYTASADHSPDALVLRIPSELEPGPRIDRIANAFSGAGHGIAPGELIAIDGTNLGPADTIDLGLNAAHDLPLELGDVQVLIDRAPVPILRASSSRLIVAVPELRDSPAVTVQVTVRGKQSNPVLSPVIAYDPAFLPWSFPAVEPGVTQQANAQNADGSRNSPQNRAAPGSLVWVFATGLGLTEPPIAAGAIAAGDSIHPVTQFRDSAYTPISGIRSMPGFISSLFAVPVRIPEVVPESGQLALRMTTATSSRGASRRSFSQPVFIYVRATQ